MSQEFFPGGRSSPAKLPPQDFRQDKIPTQLQDDALVKFFRYRYSERDDLRKSMKRKDYERLTREEKRIEDLRDVFFETHENFDLVNEYERLRVAWKNDAISKSQTEDYNTIHKKVASMKKIAAARRPDRIQLELNILDKVKKWEKMPPARVRKVPPTEEPKVDEPVAQETKRRFHLKFGHKKSSISVAHPAKANSIKSEYVESDNDDEKNSARGRSSDSYGISVSRITLEKKTENSSSYTGYKIDRFPLNDVLYEDPDEKKEIRDRNPLRRLDPALNPGTIRYFHFPSNNMHWIEEAIARYYGEKSGGEFNYRKHPEYREQSSDILCREYWSSLQHGGKYDPIHARHMRAQCSLIVPPPRLDRASSTTTRSSQSNKNFVLFMPYLHWETHQRRKKMAEVTREISLKHEKKQAHKTESRTDEFKRFVEDQLMVARRMTDCLPDKITPSKKNEQPVQKPKLLGQYLMQISKLYEAMDIEPDVRMLRDHLHENPPLHSRRTLDQSYYWKLANTDKRDEDQVVYRATKQGKNIARTTRVIMVDQLWLYILDENTIISSFPRRWGRNKPDYSGVHKGIRSILDHLREGQIQSVYDLGLLIVNQCSTVFFDRTKPVDERPELLDIFSNALSDISGMKTIAFETFWRHLDKLSEADRKFQNLEDVARKYLNINPEGKLLKEVHDIIEELRMMMRIYAQQQTVVQDFKEHLTTLHEQERKRSLKMQADDTQLNVLVEIKNLLGNNFKGAGDFSSHSKSSSGSKSSFFPDDEPLFSPTYRPNPPVQSAITENTILHAKRVADNIALRKTELQELEGSTVSIYEQLKDLLSLKQQQASIIEAKHALKRADESVVQGRSVMLFTIVTIIFLPLSFMSSVFGMNASDFDAADGNGNKMTLQHQFKLLFPISFGVILFSVFFAFSGRARSMIYFAISVTWAAFSKYTHLRPLLEKIPKSDDVWALQKSTTQKLYKRGDGRSQATEKLGGGVTSGAKTSAVRSGSSNSSSDGDSTGCFDAFKGWNDNKV